MLVQRLVLEDLFWYQREPTYPTIPRRSRCAVRLYRGLAREVTATFLNELDATRLFFRKCHDDTDGVRLILVPEKRRFRRAQREILMPIGMHAQTEDTKY
jgi:hypothetical protein